MLSSLFSVLRYLADQQLPQHTGMLFIIMQQVQPAFIIEAMQSQQAWTISQHFASPLVQVTVQPFAVISHLHMPIMRLQEQTIIPFIIMQQLTIPPAIILQRFCMVAQAIWSSQVQVIFMPPVHFSNFMVQRGTIIMLGAIGLPAADIPVVPMPGIPAMVGRSIIIVPVMFLAPSRSAEHQTRQMISVFPDFQSVLEENAGQNGCFRLPFFPHGAELTK